MYRIILKNFIEVYIKGTLKTLWNAHF